MANKLNSSVINPHLGDFCVGFFSPSNGPETAVALYSAHTEGRLKIRGVNNSNQQR
jgi:hypothetical protein